MNKKSIQRLWAALAALALLAQLALGAGAAAADRFLQRYDTAPGRLILYGSALEQPEDGQFEASLSGQQLPVVSVSTAGQQGLPVTLYCLVDISGSMRDAQMEQAKQALHTLAEALGEGDQMAIGTLGNDLTSSGFLSDPEQIAQAIDALAPDSGEDTNLYAGIVESLELLSSDTRVNPRCCLVILSDGEDDQTSGITQSEAEQAVQRSGVPVYTIATLRADPTDSQQEYAKILGSFARMSAGGAHFVPQLEDITPQQAAQTIADSLRNSLVLELDTSEVQPQKDELLLSVCCTQGTTRYTDTLTIYAQDLQPAPEAQADSQPAEQPEPEEIPVPALAAAAACLLVVLAAVLILLRRRRAKAAAEAKAAEEARAAAEAKAAEEARAAAEAKAAEEAKAAAEAKAAEEARAAEEAARQEPRTVYQIILTAIGYSSIEHRFFLPEGEERTVGRSPKADLVLDGEDRRLSGRHCSMSCTGGVLTVRDLDSTNGTFVNGVPIRQLGPTLIQSGATIRMGSYEYRVEIQKQAPDLPEI